MFPLLPYCLIISYTNVNCVSWYRVAIFSPRNLLIAFLFLFLAIWFDFLNILMWFMINHVGTIQNSLLECNLPLLLTSQASVAYSTSLYQIFWLAYYFMKCNQKICFLKDTLIALLATTRSFNLPSVYIVRLLHAFSHILLYFSSSSMIL